jgi:hypothetical protein
MNMKENYLGLCLSLLFTPLSHLPIIVFPLSLSYLISSFQLLISPIGCGALTLVAVLPLSCHFGVAPIPTRRAVARSGGVGAGLPSLSVVQVDI